MYRLLETTKFKKDLKRTLKNSIKNIELTFEVLKILENNGAEGIPIKMKPHKLKGDYKNNWECHIKPDLLIIWLQTEKPKEIILVRLGSHSELFK